MTAHFTRLLRSLVAVSSALVLMVCSAPAMADDYAALTGVKGLDSVFDFSQGSPSVALVVMPAMMDVHMNKAVRALPAAPRTVIVFHGLAVKLLSSDRTGLSKADAAAYDKVADMLRQFKQAGVKMEVCMYAVKVVGVNPATLMPEIDQVGNGFISVLGYQAQGYAVVSVP